MPNQDEPVLAATVKSPKHKVQKGSLKDKITRMMKDEMFAVLATQGKSQPYASLLGYAASDDLKKIYFATPITTRKYHLLKRCPKVAVQIDNRSKYLRKLMRVESITATGRAVELGRSSKNQAPLKNLLKRHPYFKSFYDSPTCAIFEVRVIRYLHVTRFHEVSQWTP